MKKAEKKSGSSRESRKKTVQQPRREAFLKIGTKGFTLPEALIAMAVVVIGIVGLQSAMRKGLVSSVQAWDRSLKTNIAVSRMEEHKAQLFAQYVPNMRLPIIVPVSRPATVLTPGIDFQGNTLTFTSNVRISINAETNIITAQAGYAVVFPTPSVQPTYYYGPVSTPTPGTGFAWIDVNGRSACDQTPGDIFFDFQTPPDINGTAVLWFTDYQGLRRQQRVWVDNYARPPDYAPGSISSTPSAPTTMTPVPVTRFDTADGLIRFRIQQLGVPNRTGIMMEDGTNQSGMSIVCGATPTFTTTPTQTPGSICDGNCAMVNAENNATVSGGGTFDNETSGTDHIRPEGAGGWAYYRFTNMNCPGIFQVEVGACTIPTPGLNTNLKVGLFGAAGVTVVPRWTPGADGVTAIWYPENNGAMCSDFDPMTVLHAGTGTSYSTSSVVPATWQIDGSGSVTLYFFTGNTTNTYPRIEEFCLRRIGAIPTPTPGGPTYTPTPTPPASCTFLAQPTPVQQTGLVPNYVGTPTWGQFGCDNQLGIGSFLSMPGLVDSLKVVRLVSGPVSHVLEASGFVEAYVRLLPSMSVTMRVVRNGPTTLTSTFTNPSAIQTGWYPVTTATSLSAGMTITRLLFDLAGASLSTSITNYLAIDSVRVVYAVPLNPNAVLSGASLSVLDSFRDTVTYAPKYIVDSTVRPMETPGSASGYEVEVVVHDGRNGVVLDKFPPVTIINSVSP